MTHYIGRPRIISIGPEDLYSQREFIHIIGTSIDFKSRAVEILTDAHMLPIAEVSWAKLVRPTFIHRIPFVGEHFSRLLVQHDEESLFIDLYNYHVAAIQSSSFLQAFYIITLLPDEIH